MSERREVGAARAGDARPGPVGGTPVRVKICGLTRAADARAAESLGVEYVGVILSAGFGRSVEPERAAAIVEGTSAIKVAVLVDETPAEAEARARALGASVLQLHGNEPPATLAELRLRGWRLWKAVRAGSLDDLERAIETYGELAEGLLVEGRREGVVGGGGVRLELDPDSVRARLPGEVELVLAGGLSAETVAGAVSRFRPDVVDVSSGIELTPGHKDPGLMRRFVEAARSGPATREPRPAARRSAGAGR